MKRRYTSYITFGILVLAILMGSVRAYAAQEYADKRRTLLILNAYTETAPWIRALITPITLYVANNNDIHAEIFNLNNILINDAAKYDNMKANLFATYADHKPDYLVIIGNMGFTLRQEIKKEWGDIPIILITRDLSWAPTEYFYSGFENPLTNDSFPSITELRPEYNFTAIYMPDFYQETIDMMARLIPQMQELVFFSDCVFLNRNLARDIEYYLIAEYPDIKFKWVQASQDHPDDLQYYFVNRMPKTGLLMSSWFYEKTSPMGYPTMVFGDLNLMYSSVNPIFSLRESYMGLGSIGGVYPNIEPIVQHIIEMLDCMVQKGEQMRDKPFYNSLKDQYTKISYPLLKEYGLKADACPRGTKFVDRPPTFWEHYRWHIIVTILIVGLIIFIFVRNSIVQRREIRMLSRHKRFVENMPVPYTKAKVIYDDLGNVVNIKYTIYNDAFESLLKANGSNEKPYLLFPTDFIAEKTAQMINSGATQTFLYHFDRTDKYYIFTLCLVDSDDESHKKEPGNEIDIFAIDVTTRQKTEIELKKTTQKLDITLNVAKLIPWEWRVDTDELTFDTYSLFERIGTTFDAEGAPQATTTTVSGLEFIDMLHPDDRPTLARLREGLQKGTVTEFQEQIRMMVAKVGKDTVEWIELHGKVTERDAERKPTTVTGSFMVITERKLQEMELIEAKERATESDRMKTSFLANMSHEIRTPLNAIVGFSGLMSETEDIEKRREFATIINKNNDVLLSLISDVLDLAKIESNTIDISYSVVNINTLLTTIEDTVALKMPKGVKLNMVMGAPECHVVTDGNRVSQVLMNLLTNAMKFTTKGSITFGYDILEGKELYFYVKDTGRGVSEADQKKLFTRFDKLNNFTQGNGLGLSISKSLVELLGGRIGMQSRGSGKGSTFWFTIKYRDPDQAELEAIKAQEGDAAEYAEDIHNELQAVQKASGHEAAVPQELTVLCAEDMEGNYLLIKNYLPKSYRVLHAWNGREAVDMYFDHHPDIVLMDINMPELNGYDATAEIRAVDKQVPIIAVTAYAYASDRKRILQSGFNDYLSKPVNKSDLTDVIARYGTQGGGG